MQRRAIQPQTMNTDRPHVNMHLAHAIAQLGEHGFYLDISASMPGLVTSDGATRVQISDLPPIQLRAVKNLAHDQYVRAMLNGDLDMDSHRATLNFLSRLVQKAAGSVTSAVPRPPESRRRARRAQKQAA